MTSVTDQALRSLPSALPRPGEVLHLDFRRPAEGSGSAAHGQISPSQHLRAVTVRLVLLCTCTFERNSGSRNLGSWRLLCH